MGERTATAAELSGPGSVGLPGPAWAGGLLALLVAVNGLTDAFSPDVVPDYASSPRQITGMMLMTTLLPPYLVVAAWLGQRRSLALMAELRGRLADPRAADAAADRVRTALRRTWPVGLAVGFVMSLFNTQPLEALRGPLPVLESVISLGQIVLWCIIGMLLGVRLAAARAFHGISRVAPLELLRPDRQRALARSGVVDVVIIAGALLLTPLQSLDAEFRWYNYHFGLLVGLPAVAFFLLWPVAPLLRRNRAERDARLAEIDAQIAGSAAQAPATPEASARLEALLAHRDRLRAVRIWPLSTGLLSRVLLYMVIPPLAWAGAALVERFVDRLLG